MHPTKIILPITPQTAIRMVQGDKKLFRIPEVCYKGRGSKGCKDWKRTGYCSHTLNHGGRLRKRRIERYNDYKEALRTIAKSHGFYLLDYGCAIYFHVPVPKRWSEPDKIAMHGQMNHRRPDADNFWRAFSDALRADDERISQLSGLGKFWVNQPEGYIEIVYGEVYNPHGVKFIDQSTIKSLSYNNEYNKRRKEAGYEPSHKRSTNKIKKPSDKELMSREDNIK